MTPETEALIARVRELEKRATEEGLTQPMGDELADAAPFLATALEAAEKRADELQDDKDVLTGQLQEARRRADAAEAMHAASCATSREYWQRLEAAEAKLKESSAFFEDAIGEQIIQAQMWKGHYAGDPEGQKDEAFWDGQERAFEMCLNLVKSDLTQLEP